jgi:CubicO group peptidase (beta-lactamase class C family)
MRSALTASAACLVASFCFPALPAHARPDRPPQEQLTSRIEEYLTSSVERAQFNGTVLIARDGQILFCRGYGMANLEHDVPCGPNTKFRLGSITKQFTAMAILILQERGKLSVADKVKKYIPTAGKAWDDITIHQLLTHTSGIPSYTGFPDFLKTLRNPIGLDELIAKFKDKPPDFKPGEKFQYSNSGYIVLGKIIEVASGTSYATFMKATIFDPLEMRDTGYDSAEAILKNRASGYTRLLGVVTAHATFIDMSIPHAAGALYSTVLDLLKWDRALDSEKLVPRKSLDAMFTPSKGGYGYGWTIDKKFGLSRQTHGGGIPGFVTVIERFPQEKLLIVALSNFETARIGRIGNDLAAITLGGPYVVPREPKPAKVDSAILAAYAGRYELDRGDGKEKPIYTVTAEADTLRVEAKGQGRLVAVPETATQFYLKGADTTVEFTTAPSGVVTYLTLLQDNQYLKAVKTQPPVSSAATGRTKNGPIAPSVQQPMPAAASGAGAKP